MPQCVLLQILTSCRLVKIACFLWTIDLLVESASLQEADVLHFGLPVDALRRARNPPCYERILVIVDTVHYFTVTEALVKLVDGFDGVKWCFNLSEAI